MSDWQKLERDGMVAVVYSPDYGAGWSTWNPGEHRQRLIFDSGVAEAVLAGENARAVSIARAFCPDLYDGCSSSLAVAWVPKGQPFIITENDGFEDCEFGDAFTVA